MRFTLSWLKEFLDTNASLKEILEKLTDIGLEVEEVVDYAEKLKPFIVAEIIDAAQHPEADKLRVCKVNNGKEILQIVCGAPNARAGIKVVLAPIGSLIPNGDFKIKASKIRGVESNGMLCSAEELELDGDSEGIIELPSSAIVGTPFVDAYGLNDAMIDISITPNRGDCLGVYGIARDLAARGVGQLKPLNIPNIKGNFASPIKVEILDENCPVFIGRYFKNLQNKQSPEWLQNRLRAIGSKPISALVDITNYISFTYGRPLHVYDADKLNGKIIVRKAKEGETFEALNDKSYTLTGTETVIADDKGVLALGGVIGGKDSGCSLETKNVFLEVALFDPISIAETGRKHLIDSDARYRFERIVDSGFVMNGVELASQMILDLCQGEASEIVIAGEIPKNERKLEFRIEKLHKLAGIEVETQEIIRILESLGFKCSSKGNVLELTIPTWRNDIEGEHDIVEEIVRIHGFEKVTPAWLPQKSMLPVPTLSQSQNSVKLLKRLLASRGLTEVVSWSFLSKDNAIMFGELKEELRILNPISSDLEYMRPSILPNLIEALQRNSLRGFTDISLFEIGPVFFGGTPGAQKLVIAGVRAGKTAEKSIYKEERNYDVFDIKANILACISEYGFASDKLSVDTDAPSYYHPGRSASLKIGKEVVGYFGEIHPNVQRKMDIKNAVQAFELFVEKLPVPKSKAGRKPGLKVSNFQAVERDFAFVVDQDKVAGDLIQAIKSADKNLITDVKLFDIYAGSNIEAGKKSVAVKVILQAMDRTLTEQEINNISNNVIANVEKQVGGKLRDK
jgi:phenylalanyl-tRNA synthetase beta chain